MHRKGLNGQLVPNRIMCGDPFEPLLRCYINWIPSFVDNLIWQRSNSITYVATVSYSDKWSPVNTPPPPPPSRLVLRAPWILGGADAWLACVPILHAGLSCETRHRRNFLANKPRNPGKMGSEQPRSQGGRRPNAVPMLGQRRRHCPSIGTALGRRPQYAGIAWIAGSVQCAVKCHPDCQSTPRKNLLSSSPTNYQPRTDIYPVASYPPTLSTTVLYCGPGEQAANYTTPAHFPKQKNFRNKHPPTFAEYDKKSLGFTLGYARQSSHAYIVAISRNRSKLR